jgi:hypothetical protein
MSDLVDCDPREFCKIRYSAPPECCKCGNCQLVPPEHLINWSDQLEVLSDEIENLRSQLARARAALEGVVRVADRNTDEFAAARAALTDDISQSAPERASSLPSGESDPSAMPDCAGADTDEVGKP